MGVEAAMTLYLLAWRNAVILGVTLMLIPVEIMFDGIETELLRRGVEL